MQPRPPGRRRDLNARAFACTFKRVAAREGETAVAEGVREGREGKDGTEEIDDLYRREVMDSGPRLRRA